VKDMWGWEEPGFESIFFGCPSHQNQLPMPTGLLNIVCGFKFRSQKPGYCLLKIHVHSTEHENGNARFIAFFQSQETNRLK